MPTPTPTRSCPTKSIIGPFASALVAAPAAIIIMSASMSRLRPRRSATGPPNPAPKTAPSTKGGADKADYLGFDMKLSDNERHRRAESKNGEAIKQRATCREHPKPSLDGFQRRLIQ